MIDKSETVPDEDSETQPCDEPSKETEASHIQECSKESSEVPDQEQNKEPDQDQKKLADWQKSVIRKFAPRAEEAGGLVFNSRDVILQFVLVSGLVVVVPVMFVLLSWPYIEQLDYSNTGKSILRAGISVVWIYSVIGWYVYKIMKDPANFSYEEERMQFIRENRLPRRVLTPEVGQEKEKQQ